MQKFVIAIICVIVLLVTSSVIGGPTEMIEVTTAQKRVQGKVLARTKKDFWLLGRDGRLHQLPISSVKKFQTISQTFRGLPAVQLRRQLQKEFGREYEVAGSTHYLVVAPKGQAKKYAAVFEDVYRTFHANFSARRFALEKPKFPLVAIVFADRKQFLEYSQSDGLKNASRILGYYHRRTNRVALFDTSRRKPRARKLGDVAAKNSQDSYARLSRMSGVRATMFDTIVHEATHQAAFNTGLHARLGWTPTWIVEGLATVFEAPGLRNRSAKKGARSRINRERFLWFGNYVKSRRKSKSLESFIADDELFRSAALDAYAQSWALSFYLIENRSSEYARYLQKIAARNPLMRYTPRQRVADFKQFFGNDLVRLETDFLRWIARLR